VTRPWRWLLPLLAALASGCTEHKVLEVDLGYAGGEYPTGFACRDAASVRLIERAIDRRVFSLRLDYVSLDGEFVACRGPDLRQWCSRHPCAPLQGLAPFCREAVFMPGEPGDVAVKRLFEQLLTEVPTSNAPDGVVMVRLIGASQRCDEAIVPERVVGCSHSCPLTLDRVAVGVRLEIFGTDGSCEEAVQVCASPDYRLPP
jgi:hypothetical protein